MKLTKHLVSMLLAMSLCLAGHRILADDSQQYDIELLVFQHLVNSDDGEIWHSAEVAWPEDNTAAQARSANVSWLNAADYRLAPQQASLRSSSQYRPLVHLAWRQSVQDRRSAVPVQLPVGASNTGTAYIDGNVTVAVERYLHLTLDLALHNGVSGQPAVPIKLLEQRRMRSKEIHYFDNPRFGVLALITPYQPTQ